MSATPRTLDVEAEVRRQALRALGSRARLRLLAITAWTSFLGAIPILLIWIALSPADEDLGIARLSLMFFAAWAGAAIPAGMAALLTRTPTATDNSRDGADGR